MNLLYTLFPAGASLEGAWLLYKEFPVSCAEDFAPELIFECGQCFRWNAGSDGVYEGVAGERAARVYTREGAPYIYCAEGDYPFWTEYFDLGRDYARVRALISVDGYTARAAEYGRGIRLLRQDFWEAMCSFIISQCNNITRIKGIIERLCLLAGRPFEFEGRELRAFPEARAVASLDENALAPLRCGYRASYLLAAARAVAEGAFDLEELRALPPDGLRARLKGLPGVGDKVADCIMLYGLGRLDAFPVDVWIRRALAAHYGRGFDPGVFGECAGIAQQYIFHYIRTGGKEALDA